MLSEIVIGSPLEAITPPLSWWGLTLAALLLCIRLDAVIEFFHGRLLGIAKLVLQVSAVMVLSATLGPVWRHMWEFGNWPGPPARMTEIYEFIAGASAWTVLTEMVVTLCVFFGIIAIVGNILTATRPNLRSLKAFGESILSPWR